MKNPIDVVLGRNDVALRKMPETDLAALMILAAPRTGKRYPLRSIKSLAEAIGIGNSALYKWAKHNRIPLHRAHDIARVSQKNDGLVTFDDLKPFVDLPTSAELAERRRAAKASARVDEESEDLL